MERDTKLNPSDFGIKATIEEIRENLEKLPNREAEILVMRYGLDGNEPMTLEDIGKKYGVTRERIRQIEAKALKSIRRLANGK